MGSKYTTHQQVYYQALGAMIDAEAALGADPHPVIRSVTGANAVIAEILRELLSAPMFWDAGQLRRLLAVVEGPDQVASAPASALGTTVSVTCGAPMGEGAGFRRCRLPAGHDGFHSYLGPVA